MKNYKNKNKFHKVNVAKTYFHRLSGGNNIKTNKANVNRYSFHILIDKANVKTTETKKQNPFAFIRYTVVMVFFSLFS